jgi:hypothetical protein
MFSHKNYARIHFFLLMYIHHIIHDLIAVAILSEVNKL